MSKDIQVGMNFTMKILFINIIFLVIGFVSCNTDEEILEPFDVNLLYGKWQESGRNGNASLNDNFYEFWDTSAMEQCMEGACWDGVWEWIVEGAKTKIKFNYSDPTGGWWQEFEIAYLDVDNLEVTVFDYVEGKEDPMGNGIVMNFIKLDQ